MKLASIKQIKKIPSASKRYDIEVENNHNFFTNNVLVHNSLGICFHHHNKWHLTTRGSLNSDIGVEGQKILDDVLSYEIGVSLDPHRTYLFEIIAPICQIVVKYNSLIGLFWLSNNGLISISQLNDNV